MEDLQVAPEDFLLLPPEHMLTEGCSNPKKAIIKVRTIKNVVRGEEFLADYGGDFFSPCTGTKSSPQPGSVETPKPAQSVAEPPLVSTNNLKRRADPMPREVASASKKRKTTNLPSGTTTPSGTTKPRQRKKRVTSPTAKSATSVPSSTEQKTLKPATSSNSRTPGKRTNLNVVKRTSPRIVKRQSRAPSESSEPGRRVSTRQAKRKQVIVDSSSEPDEPDWTPAEGSHSSDTDSDE